MSKFVVLSDIHANAPALEAVVEREGADSEFIILGDIHGLNAYPSETQALVQEVSNYTLAGNHDKAMFHYGEGNVNSDKLSEFEVLHTLKNLTYEQIEWVEDLPFMQVIQRGPSSSADDTVARSQTEPSRIAICHAYPWPSHASGYEPGNAGISKGSVTQVASTVGDDYDYVFHGHTHEQYDLDCAKFGHDVHFVNPGSLGYDQTYSIVETDHGGVTHKSVDIDEDSVEEHISAHLPEGAPPTRKWY